LATVFFSYSHLDESLRDELEKHLTMLKRQGLIEAWHDRRIIPGSPLDPAIGRELEAADIILLLVSSDFLHSDYCYDVEVRRAMERHERGEATVIPVILRPCDWKSAPFGGLLALPKDGKPVVAWSSRDEAFLSITEGIRAVLGNRGRGSRREPARREEPGRIGPRRGVRSGDLSIPRRFSEREKDDFLEGAFEETASLFENSLADLEERNPGIETETRYRRLDANRFTAVA
jgi:TIR domain